MNKYETYCGRVKEDTALGNITKEDTTKRRGYIAPIDLIMTRNFIAVMGFPGLILESRTLFMEHEILLNKY